ncbi:MAG: hypothetical protein JO149_06065 [Gammaproteobacteria bacterium]|nr:hypothetical protein [Gammaproteobacteria bacterium]
MTEKEAQRQAYQVWLRWEDRQQKSGLLFYFYLEKEHSNLLSFPYSSDKYQIVNAWVNEWKRKDDAEKSL